MGTYARHLKRPVDLIAGTAALVLASPLLGVAALAIRLESRGGAFFTQVRVGLDGRQFRILKFRTMRTIPDSMAADGTLLPDAARVTRVGAVLRRTSLDELPQLLNVLRGEMSLVGPRPTLPYQVERYSTEQRRRLSVRPGLTGLAQVSGRNAISWERKIEWDLEYVDDLSLKRDLNIVRQTLGVVARRESVAFTTHDDISEHGGDWLKAIGPGRDADS